VTETEKLNFLKALNKAGIEFSYADPHQGCFSISPVGALECVKDPLAYRARIWRVTVEALTEYDQWVANGCPCNATTEEGRQCRNTVDYYSTSPHNFVPGVTDRCRVHRSEKRQ